METFMTDLPDAAGRDTAGETLGSSPTPAHRGSIQVHGPGTPARSGRRAFRSPPSFSSRARPSRALSRVGLMLMAGLLFLAAGGCAALSSNGNGSAWDTADVREDEFTLEIRNQSFNEARIYIHWNGDRRRLGSVGGNQSRTFTLDWRARTLRIEVDFLAAGGFISDGVTVNPGDNLEFRIPSHAR